MQRKRSAKCTRITDGQGSATLSELHEARTAQRVEAEADALRKANAAQERAQKKAEASEAALAQLGLWRACQGRCVCTGAAALFVLMGFVLCSYCVTSKEMKFRVAACKEKAAMEAADAAAEEAGEEEEFNSDDDEAEREATTVAMAEHGS